MKNEELALDKLVAVIQKLLDENLPDQIIKRAYEYRDILGGYFVRIEIRSSGKEINRFRGQYQNFISLHLSYPGLSLSFQRYGGMGGQVLYRKIDPENPAEKFLAMKSEKIPFRTPKPEIEAVKKALKSVCVSYVRTLQGFKDRGLLLRPEKNDLSFLK